MTKDFFVCLGKGKERFWKLLGSHFFMWLPKIVMRFCNRKLSNMHKSLVILAFKKARKERRKIGDNKPSLKSLAEDIASEIDFKIGERSLRDYYNNANKLEDSDKDINISQLAVVNSISKYLGYQDYEVFISDLFPEHTNEKKSSLKIITETKNRISNGEDERSDYKPEDYKVLIWLKKNQKIVIVITFFVMITTILITSGVLEKENNRWMVWEENNYVEIKLDTNLDFNHSLEVYNQKKLKGFKKIENPNCDTEYFNKKGGPAKWYYKVESGNLEIFTTPGLHPINGKTLKPITEYMIRQHICADF